MSNIDHLFKKALQNQECEPPAHVWKNIEKQLTKRKRPVVIWWVRGVAATALIAAFIGLWQFREESYPEKLTELTEWNLPTTLPYVPLEHSDKQNSKLVATTTDIKSKENNSSAKPVEPVKEYSIPAHVLKLNETATLDKNRFVPVLNIKTSHRDFIPLTSKEALKNNETYLALLNESFEKEKSKKEKLKFALSGHFVPAYSSGIYSSSVKNARGNSYSESQMDGIMNTGGGLRVAVNTGKRFSIQTGLFYSRMGQTSTESSEGVRVGGALSVGKEERRVTTPLGNIKTRRKAVAYRSSEAIVLNSLGSSEETLEQVFGSLEIPLHARYKLNDNKVLFSLTGGFSGSFMVNNKVYLKSKNNKELLGSTDDIRNFNISTDWGIGVEYPVGRKIKIMIEPGFKYYLQSLSRSQDINYKPYLFTLSTGIGIEF